MAEKMPCFQPNTFSGDEPLEDVNSFLERYELVAIINSWNDQRKLQLLPFYVTGTAELVLKNLRLEKSEHLTWDIAKSRFEDTFSSVSNPIVLEMNLNRRKQQPDETIVQYIASVENMCFNVDSKMSESRICGHILKGINPAILQQISMLDNSTRVKLQGNLKMYNESSLLLRHSLGADTYESPSKPEIGIKSKVDTLSNIAHQIQSDRSRFVGSPRRTRPSNRSPHRRCDRSLSHSWQRNNKSESRGIIEETLKGATTGNTRGIYPDP